MKRIQLCWPCWIGKKEERECTHAMGLRIAAQKGEPDGQEVPTDPWDVFR